ncbi:TetR family transcriptional regulator [Nocardia beijingensis]|nr:TetR family transcriptional regulator [Nocardia beijingensis]
MTAGAFTDANFACGIGSHTAHSEAASVADCDPGVHPFSATSSDGGAEAALYDAVMSEPPRPDVAQRRRSIASAAIDVLADHGVRGLTHRAVDAAAGMSPGAVNYHAPTRGKLVAMAVEELFTRDYELVVTHFADVSAVDPTSIPQLAELMASLIEAMTTGPARRRALARHLLLGEAQFHPQLRDLFDQQRRAFVQFTQRLLETLEVSEPALTAEAVTVVVDGLIQRQVVIGAAPLSQAELRRVLARLLSPWNQ